MKRKDAAIVRRKAVCLAIIAMFFVNSFGGLGSVVYAQAQQLLASGAKSKFSSIEEFFNYTAGISADQQFQIINSSSVVCTRSSVHVFTDAEEGRSAYKFTCFANNIEGISMPLKLSFPGVAAGDMQFLGYTTSNESAMTFDGYVASDTQAGVKFSLIPQSRVVFNAIVYVPTPAPTSSFSGQSSSPSSPPQLDVSSNIGKVIFVDNFDDFKQFLLTLHTIESLVFLKRAYEEINNVTAGVSYSATNIQTSDSAASSMFSTLSSPEIFALLSGQGQLMEKDTPSGNYFLRYDSALNKIFVKNSDSQAAPDVGSSDVTLSFVPLNIPSPETLASNNTQPQFSFQGGTNATNPTFTIATSTETVMTLFPSMRTNGQTTTTTTAITTTTTAANATATPAGPLTLWEACSDNTCASCTSANQYDCTPAGSAAKSCSVCDNPTYYGPCLANGKASKYNDYVYFTQQGCLDRLGSASTTTTPAALKTTTMTTAAAPSFSSQTTTTSATAGTTTNTRIGDDTSRAERIAGGVTPTSTNIFDDFLNWLSNLFGASVKAQDSSSETQSSGSSWLESFLNWLFGRKPQISFTDLDLSQYKIVWRSTELNPDASGNIITQDVPVSSIEEAEFKAFEYSIGDTLSEAFRVGKKTPLESFLFGFADQKNKILYLVTADPYLTRTPEGVSAKSLENFFATYPLAKSNRVVFVAHSHPNSQPPNDYAYISTLEIEDVIEKIDSGRYGSNIRLDNYYPGKTEIFGITIGEDSGNKILEAVGQGTNRYITYAMLQSSGLSEIPAIHVTFEPSIPDGYVRLYRTEFSPGIQQVLPDKTPMWYEEEYKAIESSGAITSTTGNWFADSLKQASWYFYDRGPNSRIIYVDVSQSVAEFSKVSSGNYPDALKVSGDPEHEYILSQEHADKAVQLGKPIVIEISNPEGINPGVISITVIHYPLTKGNMEIETVPNTDGYRTILTNAEYDLEHPIVKTFDDLDSAAIFMDNSWKDEFINVFNEEITNWLRGHLSPEDFSNYNIKNDFPGIPEGLASLVIDEKGNVQLIDITQLSLARTSDSIGVNLVKKENLLQNKMTIGSFHSQPGGLTAFSPEDYETITKSESKKYILGVLGSEAKKPLWEVVDVEQFRHADFTKVRPEMFAKPATPSEVKQTIFDLVAFRKTLPSGTQTATGTVSGTQMRITSIEEYLLNELNSGKTPDQALQDLLNDQKFLDDFAKLLSDSENILNTRGSDVESLVLKAKSDFIDYLQRAGASQEVITKLKNVQMEFTDTPISAPLEGKISLSKATIVRMALSMNGDFETDLEAVANLNTAHELAHKIRTTNDNVADEQFAEGLGIAFAKSKGYDVSQVTSIHELQLNFFNSFGTGFIFGSSYSDFLQKLPSRIGNYESYIRPGLYTASFKTKIPIVSGYANPLSTAEIESLIELTKGSLELTTGTTPESQPAQKTGKNIFSGITDAANNFLKESNKVFYRFFPIGQPPEQQASTQPSAEAAAGPETPEQTGVRYANNAASMQAQQGAEKNQLRPGFDPAKPGGAAAGEIPLTDIVQLMINQKQSQGVSAAGTPIANIVSLGLSQVNNVKLQQMAQMTAILQHAMVVKANLLFASSADQLSRNLDLSAAYRVDMWQLYDTTVGMGLAPADVQQLQVGVMSNLEPGNLENLLPNDAKGNIDRNWASSAQETARQIEEENFGRPVSAYASGNQISSSTHWTTETQNKGVIGFFSFSDKYTTYTSDGKNVVKVTLDRQTLNQLEKTSMTLEGAVADMEKVSKELEAARAFDAKKLEVSVDNSGKTNVLGEASSTDPNDAIWKKQGLENLRSDTTVPENLAKEFEVDKILSGKDAVVNFENGKLTSEAVFKLDPTITEKLNLGKEWEISVNFDVKSNTAEITAKNSATGEVKRIQMDENGNVKNSISENPVTGEKLQGTVDPEGNIQGQGINEKLSLKSGVTVTGDKVTVQDFSGAEPVKLEFNLQSFTKAEFGKLITDALNSGKELNAVAVVRDTITGKPTTVEISINKDGGLTLTRDGTKTLLSREQALEFAKNEVPDNLKAAVIESGKFKVGVLDIAFDIIAIASFAFQVTNVLTSLSTTGQTGLGLGTPQEFQNTVSFGIGAAFAAAATAHVASIIMAESVTLTLGAGSLLGPVGLALMVGATVATEAAPFAFANNQLTGKFWVSPTGMDLATQTFNSMKISFSGQANLLANNIAFGQMYQNELSKISTQVGGVKTTTTPGHYVIAGKGGVVFVPESTSSNEASIGTDAYVSATSKFLLTPVKTATFINRAGQPYEVVVQTTGDLVNELYSATSAQQKQAIAAQLASIHGTTPDVELLSALLHNSAQAQQLEQQLQLAKNGFYTNDKYGTAQFHTQNAVANFQNQLSHAQASLEADQQAYTDAVIKQLGGTRTGENTFTFTENGNTFTGRIDPTTGTYTKELTGFTDKNGVDWTKVSPDTWTTSDGKTFKVIPASEVAAQLSAHYGARIQGVTQDVLQLESFTLGGNVYTRQPDGTYKDAQGNVLVMDAKGNLMEPSFTDSSGHVWNLNTQTGQYESTWTDQGATYTGTYDPATQTATIIGGGTTTVIDYKTNTATTTFTDKTGHTVTQKSQSFGKVAVTTTTAWVGETSTTAGHYGTTTTVTIPGGTDEDGNPTGLTGTVNTYTVNPLDGSVSVTGYAGDLGQLSEMTFSPNREGTVAVSKTTYDGTNYGEIYVGGRLTQICSGCTDVSVDQDGHVTFKDKAGNTKNGFELPGGGYVGEVANPTGANDYYGRHVLCSGGSCEWCNAQCYEYRKKQAYVPEEYQASVTTSDQISAFIDNLISQFFQLIFGSNVPGSVAGSIVPSRTLSQEQIQNLADSQKTNFSSFISPDQIVATTQP